MSRKRKRQKLPGNVPGGRKQEGRESKVNHRRGNKQAQAGKWIRGNVPDYAASPPNGIRRQTRGGAQANSDPALSTGGEGVKSDPNDG